MITDKPPETLSQTTNNIIILSEEMVDNRGVLNYVCSRSQYILYSVHLTQYGIHLLKHTRLCVL